MMPDKETNKRAGVQAVRQAHIGEVECLFKKFLEDAELADLILMRDALREHDGQCLEGEIVLPAIFAELLGVDVTDILNQEVARS